LGVVVPGSKVQQPRTYALRLNLVFALLVEIYGACMIIGAWRIIIFKNGEGLDGSA